MNRVNNCAVHAAYGRIEAARVARKFPIVLQLLEEGSITLTTVCLLAPHLTVDNCDQVLGAARSKTKREVEQQVAALSPRPAVRSAVRKLPVATSERNSMPVATSASAVEVSTNQSAQLQAEDLAVHATPTPLPRAAAMIAPLAPERYKVQITITRETHDKLRRIQDLLRHVVPNGDPPSSLIVLSRCY